MDKMSRILDEKYKEIQVKEMQEEFHNRAVQMYRQMGVSTDAVESQVRHHEQAIAELRKAGLAARLEFVDDLMLVDDINVLDVLKERYLDFQTWEEIGRLHDHNRDWAMKIRDKGLRMILKGKQKRQAQ